MIDLLAIYRAERFSPNSVDKDKAIIEAVTNKLAEKGYNIRYTQEEELTGNEHADIILTMGRQNSTLAFLEKAEASGAVVINSAQSVRNCARATIDRLMRANNLPAAPLTSTCGYWVKRGDEAAQNPNDVMFAADEQEKQAILNAFNLRGITSIVATAHVEGDLVKFYGVAGTNFFAVFYPGDDGCFKFNDELKNGKPNHFDFNKEALHADSTRLAELTGIRIYGGDCIVRNDGTYAIIDFNDWPSFSRCRAEAAEAIASIVTEIKFKH